MENKRDVPNRTTQRVYGLELDRKSLGFVSPCIIEIRKRSLGTEEKRGTTFRSSADEIFETPTWNNKKLDKDKNGSREHSKGNKTVPGKVATTHTEDGHKQVT